MNIATNKKTVILCIAILLFFSFSLALMMKQKTPAQQKETLNNRPKDIPAPQRVETAGGFSFTYPDNWIIGSVQTNGLENIVEWLQVIPDKSSYIQQALPHAVEVMVYHMSAQQIKDVLYTSDILFVDEQDFRVNNKQGLRVTLGTNNKSNNKIMNTDYYIFSKNNATLLLVSTRESLETDLTTQHILQTLEF